MKAAQPPTQRVARGALVLMVFQIAGKALYLVFFILLGNRALFSEDDYGRLEGLLAVTNVFFIFADLGLEAFLTRELARLREETTKRLPQLVLLKIVLTGAACFLLALWSLGTMGAGSGFRGAAILLGCAVLLSAISIQSLVRSVSRAEQRMEIEGMMGVIEKTVTLLFGGLFLFLGARVGGMVWVIAAAGVCSAAYGYIRVRSFQPSLRPGRPAAFSALKHSLPFGLSAVCVLLFYNMDRLMLFHFGDVWAGRYARGFRVVMGLLLFPQMMSISIYPALSKLKNDPVARVRVGRESLQTLFFVAFPLVVGGWLLAGPLVDTLYGRADPSTISWRWDSFLGRGTVQGNGTESAVLRILLLSLPLTCCNYLFGPALNALDRQVWNLKASAVTAVANILLNALLIPVLGPVGAAVATTLTQGSYCWALYHYLRRLDASWLSGGRYGAFATAVFAMAFVVLFLAGRSVPTRILAGGVCYMILTGLLGLWPAFGFLFREGGSFPMIREEGNKE